MMIEADEERIPSVPHHNQLFEDDMGIVWRWDDQVENWIKEFYDFEPPEEKTLLRIIKFYKSIVETAPEEMVEEQDEYDRESLDGALNFFIKKFSDE